MSLGLRSTPGFARQDARDLAAIERWARSTLKQCEYLRRNGPTDRIRFMLIACDAFRAFIAAARADRRYAKDSASAIFVWRLPRGYSDVR